MATTVPDPIDGEHPGLKIMATINDGCQTYVVNNGCQTYLVTMEPRPCDGCKGGAKSLFLHPGEKARRDPRRFSSYPSSCEQCLLNGGSCPKGDDCPSAHGSLDEWLQDIMKNKLQLHGHHLDAVERVPINLIPDLERNGQIFGYEYACHVPDDMLCEKGLTSYLSGVMKMGLGPFADYNVPHNTPQVAASKLDPSFYDGTSKYKQLADARAASNGIVNHGLFKTISGNTYAGGNTLTLRNDRPVIVSSGGGSHGLPQDLSSYYSGSDKKLFPTDVVAATAAAERVGLCAAAAASPTAGGIDEPELDAILDSGASVHVVGEDTELQRYQPLAEPCQIAVANGHLLDVLGVGYIETPRGSFRVPRVFKVRGLEMNLISVGQLDRDHGLCSSFRDKRCEVQTQTPDRNVIGGAFLQANNLYALRFLQVPEN